MDFDHKIVVMDMSGMLVEEGFCPADACVLDFRGLAGTECLCDDEALRELRRALAPLPAEGIHFIDGGDWHYLSLLWMEKITEPFGLYLFDNHPDNQPASFGEDILSCGSWVLAACRTLPLLWDVVWINAAPGHLSGPSPLLRKGDGPCLAGAASNNGERSPSGAFPQPAVRWARTRFKRSEGNGSTLERIPAYISIDLDVLSREEAVTNWDQGTMRLTELMDSISKIAADQKIIGVDICGGILPSQGACTCDLATNKRTRQKLLEFLLSLQQ